ncbi:heat-inducible transcriptional repressor HrcA [Paratissierella segnis]|jgi:heat-inducible transcriptional repressor|uniref:Heat-inducible transcription repressor HrcA n=1 Tax=Paratissierella segnis TaxID=2763679 RepID=A0A926EVQ5_9FIRM|nr:heat-inducible transcriptional repressor HrcA [Paratissierella segnis]MBC8588392.1 heat-inducible transcription repressor HrcA [Paratissierella segnis]
MLDERKLKVLYAIINSYILSGEPISSRTISKIYNLGVSSATIRNEMSDLEDLGFLNKPHTSAGRVPSDRAYRLYVDSILKLDNSNIDNNLKNKIKKTLIEESKEMDQLLQNAAKILSKITKYTALAISPQLSKSKIKHIQLIPIENNQILLVLVNNSDIVKNTIFKVDSTISPGQLNIISNYLTHKLRGVLFSEIPNEIDFKEMYAYKEILDKILPMLNDSFDIMDSIDLYSEGITQLLNFPEYKDVDKAKSIISFIENKDLVLDVLLEDEIMEGIKIIIGNENIYEPIKDSSIITASYSVNGKNIGKIGVIGPTRMDYLRLINILKIFSLNLTEIINFYSGN